MDKGIYRYVEGEDHRVPHSMREEVLNFFDVVLYYISLSSPFPRHHVGTRGVCWGDV